MKGVILYKLQLFANIFKRIILNAWIKVTRFESSLDIAIRSVSQKLTVEQYSLIKECVDHDEAELAIEFLIEYLSDNQAEITVSQFALIVSEYAQMGQQNSVMLKNLVELVKK